MLGFLPAPPSVAEEPNGRRRTKRGSQSRWSLLVTGDWELARSLMNNPHNPRLYDLSQGTIQQSHRVETNAVVTQLRFNGDDRWLAAGGVDGTICVLKLRVGISCQIINAHKAPITALNFSDDNRRLLSGSADGSVKRWDLWDLDSPAEVFPGLDDEVSDIQASSDGALLAAAAGQTVAVWTLDPHTLAAKACATAGRPFSTEEIQQYSSKSWLSTLLGPSLDEICSDQRDRLQARLP